MMTLTIQEITTDREIFKWTIRQKQVSLIAHAEFQPRATYFPSKAELFHGGEDASKSVSAVAAERIVG